MDIDLICLLLNPFMCSFVALSFSRVIHNLQASIDDAVGRFLTDQLASNDLDASLSLWQAGAFCCYEGLQSFNETEALKLYSLPSGRILGIFYVLP